jgi:TRAP-type C4-dicarboxylate transport system permease large subunit
MVPYFLTVGVIMNYSGITKRLMNFCDCLLGHKVGGLAQVNVLLSTINGGICGSGAADAAMQCKILVPEMTKRGYPVPFSAAVTAASGLIAPVIPPGVALIRLRRDDGDLGRQNVRRRLCTGNTDVRCRNDYGGIIAHKRHYAPSRDRRATLREILRTLKDSIWASLIPAIIISGFAADCSRRPSPLF